QIPSSFILNSLHNIHFFICRKVVQLFWFKYFLHYSSVQDNRLLTKKKLMYMSHYSKTPWKLCGATLGKEMMRGYGELINDSVYMGSNYNIVYTVKNNYNIITRCHQNKLIISYKYRW
ncbi:hypothetical protein Leryth_011507, partial [Lithospermum erythrorhizon]